MPNEIEIAQAVSLRDAHFDEYWLQDQIFENPNCLGLGELEAIAKERQQSSGGRLDILLKDPEDDTMYEVEIMLGETNETHIIRTIEYWDNEKRKFPMRQHYAVLVAEHINRRFFNVVHLLSLSIPIIAIQVSLLSINGQKTLFFTKVLDTYEEVDDGSPPDDKIYDREYWLARRKWTVEAAEEMNRLVGGVLNQSELNFVKNYVAITVDGSNYMVFRKRSHNKSLLEFRMTTSLQDQTAGLLDARNITYVRKPSKFFITVDKAMIAANSELFIEVAKLVKKSWEGTA